MKQLLSLVLSSFLTVSFLNAEKKIPDELIVQKLVENVKKSKNDERRKAMNALKIKLRSMNQETRRHVMADLQKNFVRNSQYLQNKSNLYLPKHQDKSIVHPREGSEHRLPTIREQHPQIPDHLSPVSHRQSYIPSQYSPKAGRHGGHR